MCACVLLGTIRIKRIRKTNSDLIGLLFIHAYNLVLFSSLAGQEFLLNGWESYDIQKEFQRQQV